jgi:hypothetical protein
MRGSGRKNAGIPRVVRDASIPARALTGILCVIVIVIIVIVIVCIPRAGILDLPFPAFDWTKYFSLYMSDHWRNRLI